MTGWSLPSISPEAMRKTMAYPIWPAAPVTATRTGGLLMMFATPCEDYNPNEVLVRAMDRIFILHADHEQNASTSTVRLCGSSGTNPFAAIAAGVACLWGPAHGGANEAALNMFGDILSDEAAMLTGSIGMPARRAPLRGAASPGAQGQRYRRAGLGPVRQ